MADRYWDQEALVAADLLDGPPHRPDDLDPAVLAPASTGCSRSPTDGDQRLAAAVLRAVPGQRARRRPGHRQDHHGRPAAGPAARAGPELRGSRSPRRPARRRPGCRRPCGPRPPSSRAEDRAAARRAAGDDAAPAARLAARCADSRFRHDRAQPAAVRRGRRRRELDGVADDDGPAARGAAADDPAGAGRRPGPAGVGGGRCGARRPGRPHDAGRPYHRIRDGVASRAADGDGDRATRPGHPVRRGHRADGQPAIHGCRRHPRPRNRNQGRRRRGRADPAAVGQRERGARRGRRRRPANRSSSSAASARTSTSSARRCTMPPSEATTPPRWKRWSCTGCCAPTAAVRAACSTGAR